MLSGTMVCHESAKKIVNKSLQKHKMVWHGMIRTGKQLNLVQMNKISYLTTLVHHVYICFAFKCSMAVTTQDTYGTLTA